MHKQEIDKQDQTFYMLLNPTDKFLICDSDPAYLDISFIIEKSVFGPVMDAEEVNALFGFYV